VVVLAGISQGACRELSAIHGLSVTTVADLDATVAEALTPPCSPQQSDLAEADGLRPPQAGGPAQVASPADVERLRGLLRRCGLRPRGEERRAILAATVAALDGTPRPVRELKANVADAVGASRGAVQDVLAALCRGGGLLGEDGSPVGNLGAAAATVVSDCVDVLEDRCLESYRAAVRAQDPTAMATATAEAALRAATQAEPPRPAAGSQPKTTPPRADGGEPSSRGQ